MLEGECKRLEIGMIKRESVDSRRDIGPSWAYNYLKLLGIYSYHKNKHGILSSYNSILVVTLNRLSRNSDL